MATLTGGIGKGSKWLLDKIVGLLAATGVNPNFLTFLGLVVNFGAAALFAVGHFFTGALVIFFAGFLDMLDGQVARRQGRVTAFGAFYDSTLDRYADMALYMGLLVYYSVNGRTPYVVLAAVATAGSVMVSYARARAECLIEKCKVGFMERPERIVLFWIGAFTNRMAAVLWVILVLSILAVADRIYYTYLALNKLPLPSREGLAGVFNRAFFWTDERATLPYDLWVIAILAFVWLVPPAWLGDPMAHDPGLIAWVAERIRN